MELMRLHMYLGIRNQEWDMKYKFAVKLPPLAMNILHVFDHIIFYSKKLTANVTFVVPFNIMNPFFMIFQMSCLSEWFATTFTFVIFVAFMNCVDVILQTSCSRKWFTTRFTFVISAAFMHFMDVFLQICFWKWFSTRFTVVISEVFVNYMGALS